MSTLKNLYDYFKTLNVSVTLYPEQRQNNYDDFDEFALFVKKEMEFWQILNINDFAREQFKKFQEISNDIDLAIRNAEDNNDFNFYINSATQKIKNIGLLFSDTALMHFIKDLSMKQTRIAEGALDYFSNRDLSIQRFSDKLYFNGILEAYDWSEANNYINKFKDSQNKVFEDMKKQYSEGINVIKKEIQDFRRSSSDIKKEVQNKHKKLEVEVTDKYQKCISDFEQIAKIKISEMEETIKQTQTNLKSLESTYVEQMRLETPAKYWSKLEFQYRNKGILWTCISILWAVLMIFGLVLILYNIPDILKLENNNSFMSGFRGILILAVTVAIGIYLIRLFVKLATSAYHLSRDAKERYQLTYVYLSLIKDNSIEEKDRFIILESLFSRADTGLIKGDSSPAFPSGLAGIMKDLFIK